MSTQLFVSSACRLAHRPKPNAVQKRVPRTSRAVTPIVCRACVDSWLSGVSGNHPVGVMRSRRPAGRCERIATCRITYVGHATVLIELGGVRLLTDPVLRAAGRSPAPARPAPRPPRESDRRRPDLAPALRPSRPALAAAAPGPRPRVIVPRGAGALLGRAGLARPTSSRRASRRSVRRSARSAPSRPSTTRGAGRGAGPTAEPLGFVVGAAPVGLLRRRHRPLRRRWPSWRRVDVALLPVAAGARGSAPATWTPSAPPRRPRCSSRGSPCRSTGARFHPASRGPGAWFTDPPHEFAAQVAELAPDVEVRVLEPGESTRLAVGVLAEPGEPAAQDPVDRSAPTTGSSGQAARPGAARTGGSGRRPGRRASRPAPRTPPPRRPRPSRCC